MPSDLNVAENLNECWKRNFRVTKFSKKAQHEYNFSKSLSPGNPALEKNRRFLVRSFKWESGDRSPVKHQPVKPQSR